MPYAADGPKTGRIAHGFEEARAAGVPWEMIKGRSGAVYQADVDRRRAERALAKALQEKSLHPERLARVHEMILADADPRDVLAEVNRPGKLTATEIRNRAEALRRERGR
jgi:hypothetical protein